MLLALGENLEGVEGLFAVCWHYSVLYVLALLSIHSCFAAFIFLRTLLFTFLYSSPASVLVYFCCFSCRLWSHRSRTSFVAQGWIFFLCLPEGPLQLLRVAILLDCSQGYLRRRQGRKGLYTYLSPEHFPYFLVFEFLPCRIGCKDSSLNAWFSASTSMVINMRSWLLPMSASGKDLLFALLMLDLKRLSVRMKSIWLWTCPLRACQVVS